MPFGLVNATATFNRLMKKCLSDCRKFCDTFVDDIIIFSNTFEEHLMHIKTTLNALSKAGLTIKKRKM